MTRDELIDAVAAKEADYDGRTFAGLGRMERLRYTQRCAAMLSAIEAAGLAIVPMEATPDQFTAGHSAVRSMDARAVKTVDWEIVYAAMVAAGRV